MTAATVTDGGSVNLTCNTTCTLIGHTYIWYRNKQLLTNQEVSLHLNPVSSEDAGNYSCAVKGLESLLSPEKKFIVTYGPRNTSVSPSGEIVEGSSVTLTCSSDANPPVDKYTWYMKNVTTPKASGQSYNITNITSEDSGEYYCEAQNKYGRLNSSTLSVDVQWNQTSVLTASVGITVVVLVLILCLSGLICFRKKASKFTASDGQEGDYVNVNISNKTIAPTAQQRAKTTDNEEEESVYANVSNMAMTPSAKDRRHQK
uniref:Ig-like domain-containing protein n=1 Tax=Esox lucius TaxID=8010 RepID=A0AAY5JYN0_ESOLU